MVVALSPLARGRLSRMPRFSLLRKVTAAAAGYRCIGALNINTVSSLPLYLRVLVPDLLVMRFGVVESPLRCCSFLGAPVTRTRFGRRGTGRRDSDRGGSAND